MDLFHNVHYSVFKLKPKPNIRHGFVTSFFLLLMKTRILILLDLVGKGGKSRSVTRDTSQHHKTELTKKKGHIYLISKIFCIGSILYQTINGASASPNFDSVSFRQHRMQWDTHSLLTLINTINK